MIVKTLGVVVNYIKYSETSIIVRMYTQTHGFQSFIASGVRSKKAKLGIGMFQPLNVLELVAYWSGKSHLHRINEAKVAQNTPSFQLDPKKGAMVMFISEMMGKTLQHEHEQNESLYEFMVESIVELDQMSDGFEAYHIYFMIRFVRFLGFEIRRVEDVISDIDDVDEPAHRFLSDILRLDSYQNVQSTGEIKSEALAVLIRYYREHIDRFQDLNSLKVLRQVFH